MSKHPLQYVFDEAIKQVESGKGAERHGTVKDFLFQPIFNIGKLTGPRGLMFQSVKKMHEAIFCLENGKFTKDQTVEELLGALVYLASLIILVNDEEEKKKVEPDYKDTEEEVTMAMGFQMPRVIVNAEDTD